MKKSKITIGFLILAFVLVFSFTIFKSNVFAAEDQNTQENTSINSIFDIDAQTEAYKFSEKRSPKGPFIRYIQERVIVDKELSGIGTTISEKTIDVTAPTTGIQVLLAADTVRIDSSMEYAVVFSQTNVIIDGNITKDLVVFAGSKVTIGENANISGDIICYSNEIEVKGNVEGNLVGTAQKLIISGNIGKDLRMQLNNIELLDGNSINGDIFFMTYNKELNIKEKYPNAQIKVYEEKSGLLDASTILSGVITSLAFTLLYLLIEKFTKGKVFLKMITKTRDNLLFFVISGGLSLMMVLPLVFILIMLAAFGLGQIAIPALILYVSYLLVVGLLSTFIIGSFLVKYMADTRFKAMGNGTKILSAFVIFMLLFILAKLPTVGIYITILLVMFAIGIVTTCIFKGKKNTDISKVK